MPDADDRRRREAPRPPPLADRAGPARDPAPPVKPQPAPVKTQLAPVKPPQAPVGPSVRSIGWMAAGGLLLLILIVLGVAANRTPPTRPVVSSAPVMSSAPSPSPPPVSTPVSPTPSPPGPGQSTLVAHRNVLGASLVVDQGRPMVFDTYEVTMDLEPGVHQVKVSLPRRLPARYSVDIASGQNQTLYIEMEELGVLSVEWRPKHAVCRVRELSFTSGPEHAGFAEFSNLRKGVYRIVVSAPGYETMVQLVNLEPGQRLPIHLVLQKQKL